MEHENDDPIFRHSSGAAEIHSFPCAGVVVLKSPADEKLSIRLLGYAVNDVICCQAWNERSIDLAWPG
jgi:hypothetical protein